MPARRDLTFNTLDDIVRDAENLLAKGYDKAGNWDLGQCCGHLTHWLTYPINGFPKVPLLLRPLFWAFRNTFAPRMFRKSVASGKTKPGIPTVPASVPAAGGDDTKAVGALRAAVARWQANEKLLHASPLFGRMTKDQWTPGHLMHSAHHLSFLVPKANGTA